MTSMSDMTWEELTTSHGTPVLAEATRRLVVEIGALHGATVSQQETTNGLTKVLIGLTVVIAGLTIAQVVFFLLGVRG